MGRKRANRIYSMFHYEEEIKKSKCLMEGCNMFIKGNHAGNLLRHFNAQHELKYDEIVKLNNEDKENVPPSGSENAATVMQYCTELITVHGRPLSIVEDEAFEKILRLIPGLTQRDVNSINVKNVKENIKQQSHDVRFEITKQLNNKLVALKVDVASVKLRRFLGLNVQYISDGQIHLKNLSVLELHDRNTAQYLKENVVLILSRYGITPNQIFTITTDNGANMIRMVNELNDSAIQDSENEVEVTVGDESDDIVELQVQDEDSDMRKIIGIRCAAHCLQLAVKDACKDIEDFFEKCRKIVRKLRTPNMSLKLKEKNLPQAVLDTQTRWDSTADMLENLQKLKPFCMENMTMEENIWGQIDGYLDILLPCRILSKRLQTEQLTCGDFYLAWMRCHHQLSLVDDAFARQLESCMDERQAVLFVNEHFLAAIYLDPRVNFALNTNQATEARKFLTDIYMRIVKLKQHQGQSQPVPGTSETSEADTRASDSFEDYLRHQFAGNERINVQFTLENELIYKLVSFLQEPALPPNSNILEYWSLKKVSHPYLYNMAMVVLATPPTSVSVERLFSSLKFVLNNLRMRLNDSIIEDIMLIRNNNLYSK
ncbi:uncharacterized protein LOC134747389 [Cydia strobilella]|uniref:uncharacterized protein LOC134747389 n=1 Tax=Cydia strobilella TaxID=1100964 RepID=UPI0030071E1C